MIHTPEARTLQSDLRQAILESQWKDLRSYFRKRLASSSDINDLTQEVCIRFLSSGQCPDKPRSYLYGIAARVLADFLAARSREHVYVCMDSNLVDHTCDALENLLAADPADALHAQKSLVRTLSRLPATHAAVLLAHERDGLTYKEVAEKLSLSIHTVKKYIAQAKAELRHRRSESRSRTQ